MKHRSQVTKAAQFFSNLVATGWIKCSRSDSETLTVKRLKILGGMMWANILVRCGTPRK